MHEKILVLAPHVDDESLSCGGTIARMVDEGRKVTVSAFSRAEISLQEPYTPEAITREFFEAIYQLGCPGHILDFRTRDFHLSRQDILDTMLYLKQTLKPDLVICPSLGDIHQDHKVIADEACRAFWDSDIWCFEAPRKCRDFKPRVYVRLEDSHMVRKMAAIDCYSSQLEKDNFPGQSGVINGSARLRGIQCGAKFAEAFECVQMMV
jgi:LmbE family N-acetylglucosaminyl deacetylase